MVPDCLVRGHHLIDLGGGRGAWLFHVGARSVPGGGHHRLQVVARKPGRNYGDVRLFGAQHLVVVGVAARRASPAHGLVAAFLILVRDRDYLGALDPDECQVHLVAVSTAPGEVGKRVSDDSDAKCPGCHLAPPLEPPSAGYGWSGKYELKGNEGRPENLPSTRAICVGRCEGR